MNVCASTSISKGFGTSGTGISENETRMYSALTGLVDTEDPSTGVEKP